MKSSIFKTSLISLVASSLMTGCLDSNNDENPKAVSCLPEQLNMAIQTVAADFSSSAVALGCSIEVGAQDRLLIKDKSDYRISASNNALYHIGRSAIDTVEKYGFDSSINSELPQWKYSLNDAEGSTNAAISANPYKVIQVSDTKAYIIRYGKLEAWQVNPSATTAAEFKIGTLDLSAYAPQGDQDGTPVTAKSVDMSDAVIVNGKLYIAMQRLRTGATKEGKYGPSDVRDYTNESKVAVFNINNNQEIGSAIILTGHNVQSLVVEGDNIYAVSRGDYGSDFGAIDVIDSNTNTITASFDGAQQSAQDQGLGHIVGLTVHNNNAYILGSPSYKNASLFNFDITANTLGSKIDFLAASNITNIAEGPEGFLWLLSAKDDNPGVYKLAADTAQPVKNANGGKAFIATELNPTTIVFKQ